MTDDVSFEGSPPWLLESLNHAADTKRPFVERVRAADDAARLAKRYLADVVAYGLAVDGRSWADVGEALGITRQAAFQRFRSADRDPD